MDTPLPEYLTCAQIPLKQMERHTYAQYYKFAITQVPHKPAGLLTYSGSSSKPSAPL